MIRRGRTLTALLALVLAFSLGAPPAGTMASLPQRIAIVDVPDGAEVDPSTVVIRFARRSTDAARLAALARHGLQRRARTIGSTSYVEIPAEGRSRETIRSLLHGEDDVVAVEPNLVRRAMADPLDAEYEAQRAYFELLRLPAAHALVDFTTSTSARDTVIAVIDTGVDGTNPDLVDRVVAGSDDDVQGHGTQVAGVAAAATDNGYGIASAAHTAAILGIRVLEETEDGGTTGTDATVAAGVERAIEAGVDVINLSLGGRGGPGGPLAEAIAHAVASDIVVVASAGNDGAPFPIYPAAYPGVLAVGATDHGGEVVSFSQHGSWLDLAAPGHAIATTTRLADDRDRIGTSSGTSFSAPLVAGIAALVRTQHPTWTAAEVSAQLKATARDVGLPGDDNAYGAGIVDAYAALTGERQAPKPMLDGEVTPNATPDRATTVLVGSSVLGAITPEGDRDWVRIPAGSADVDVAVTQNPAASGTRALDLVLRLYDSELDLVGVVDSMSATSPESISFRGAGDVYVEVSNFNATPSPGTYSFAVSSAGSPRATAIGAEREWVRDTTPPDATAGVAVDAAVSVRFARDVDASTIGPTTVELIDGRTGRTIAGSSTFDAATDRLTMTPAAPLTGGTAYHLRANGVCSTGGERMAGAVIARFRTAGGLDPVTLASIPAPAATSAPQPPACPSPQPPPTTTTTTTTTSPAPTTTIPRSSAPPPPPPSPAPAKSGYWMVGRDGAVYAFGDAVNFGHVTGMVGTEAVDLEPTPSLGGYWIVTNLGHVHAFGNAPYFGGLNEAVGFGESVTSISATSTGRGYWLFTTKGRVVGFGDARHLGDMSAVRLNGPVLDSIPSPSGNGYYMVASDGGIFTFGDAEFQGSMGGIALNAPVQSLVPDADGTGYWLVASDGGIFSFAAPFRGSMGDVRLNGPITGMVRFGDGYLMVGTDGGIFTFTNKEFHGSLGANPPGSPIVSVAVAEG